MLITVSLCLGKRNHTDKEVKLKAGRNDAAEIQPHHDTEDETRDNLEPHEHHVGRQPLPPVDGRLCLSKGLCAVEDDDTQGQAPDDGGDVHVILVGEVVLEVLGHEKASLGSHGEGWSRSLISVRFPFHPPSFSLYRVCVMYDAPEM